MRQDLTNAPVFRDLTKAGIPDQVALRAAWLLGGRRTMFVDFSRTPTPADEPITGTVHEIVLITDGRVIHVRAIEREELDSRGNRFIFQAADVWSRDSLIRVTADGDERAWEALLGDEKIAATLDPLTSSVALRRYVLHFADRQAPVTIPLSAAMQNDADQTASCLAYEVKNGR